MEWVKRTKLESEDDSYTGRESFVRWQIHGRLLDVDDDCRLNHPLDMWSYITASIRNDVSTESFVFCRNLTNENPAKSKAKEYFTFDKHTESREGGVHSHEMDSLRKGPQSMELFSSGISLS